MRNIIFILSFFVLTISVKSQNVNSTYVNNLLGAGVNGYGMISNGVATWPTAYYTELKDSGFSSVRIVYEPGQTLYTISSATLLMLKGIVDECLAADLIPVLDYHITPLWFQNYTSQQGAMFVSNWSAMASYFSSYTYDQLVMELVNEPRDISASTWNALAASSVAAIRAQDADRVIMLSPLEWGHVEGLRTFILPNADNLILSIHYYEPSWMVYQNCPWVGSMNGEAYTGTHWRNLQPIVDNLEDKFTPVLDFQDANDNIPVNIGEYGTTIYADSLNRIKYYTYLTRTWERLGFSYSTWEYKDWFGIKKNPDLGVTNLTGFYPGLTEAITSTPLVLDSYDSTIIINELFNSVGTWTTYQAGSGAVSISVSGGELVINVSGTDYNYLNARVYTPVFNLEKDSIYRVSYTIRTGSGTKTFAHKYSGNHPWFYTYDLESVFEKRCETYIMPTTTQSGTSLEFLFGAGTGIIYLKDFKLERLTVIPTVPVEEDTCDYHITVYDTISIADSSLFNFENNLTAAYGDMTVTNHSTTYTTSHQCQGTYGVNTDIYLSWLETSSITLADSFNLSIYYKAWYTTGTIYSNYGNTGSGFKLNRSGSNLIFTTSNGTNTAALNSNGIISNGNCYLIEVRARRSTGEARIYINGTNQTFSGSILTDFSLTGSIGIGANNVGGNQSWSYLDQFKYSTFDYSVTATDTCIMADTITGCDTLFLIDANQLYHCEKYNDATCADSCVLLDVSDAYVYFSNIDFSACPANRLTLRYHNRVSAGTEIARLSLTEGGEPVAVFTSNGTSNCITTNVALSQPLNGLTDLYLYLTANTGMEYISLIFQHDTEPYFKFKPIYINAANHGVIYNNGRYYALPN
jgi:endoglucanase